MRKENDAEAEKYQEEVGEKVNDGGG